MPNWCWNELHITGPEEQIARFLSRVKVDEDNSEVEYEIIPRLIPLPTEATKEIVNSDGSKTTIFTDDGYDTAVKLWGTKWADVHTELVSSEPQYLLFEFDSAWSPPIAGIIRVSELFPELRFVLNYYESGMTFRGQSTITKGREISESFDGEWCIDYATMESANLTEDEMETAGDTFWSEYSEERFDFSKSAKEITEEITQEILAMRKGEGA